MSKFPLFETLNRNLKSSDLTKMQKQELVDNIAKFADEQCELVYALIRAYENENCSSPSFVLPYGGVRSGENELTFDLAKFPPKLRRLLHDFMKMHIEKVATDARERAAVPVVVAATAPTPDAKSSKKTTAKSSPPLQSPGPSIAKKTKSKPSK
jgi:hypothetical protein